MGLIALSIFFTFLILVYIGGKVVLRNRHRMSIRLRALADSNPGLADVVYEGKRSRVHRASLRLMDGQLIIRIEAWLKSADLAIEPAEFLSRWFLLVAIATALAGTFRGIWGALLILVFCILGTYGYFRLSANRRQKRFDASLVDMLTMLVNSLRAGFSLLQSINVLRDDMEGPIKEEMGRIIAETQIGISIEEALARSVQRVNSPDFELVVTAINIQRTIGGNLSEVLDQIADTIRERVHLKAEVRTLTAQGRITTIIFLVLPPTLAAIISFLNPSYMGILIQTAIGRGLIVTGLVLQVIGYFFVRRVTFIEL